MKYRLNQPLWTLAAGVTFLMLILAATAPNALRTMLGLSLVLFLPGFALTIILFNGERLGIAERLLLSVGLSVAITALIGLILHWTPWGLRTTTLWAALLFGIALEVVVIAFVRRLGWTDAVSLLVSMNFHTRQWVFLGLAALVTMMAIHVARTPASPQGFEGYTTLWIQPADMPDTLRLGVISEEFETTKYQIRFELNGAIREGATLELKPGETWEGVLRLPSDQLVVGNPLTVFLYRLDSPTGAYRHVVWWPETD